METSNPLSWEWPSQTVLQPRDEAALDEADITTATPVTPSQQSFLSQNALSRLLALKLGVFSLSSFDANTGCFDVPTTGTGVMADLLESFSFTLNAQEGQANYASEDLATLFHQTFVGDENFALPPTLNVDVDLDVWSTTSASFPSGQHAAAGIGTIGSLAQLPPFGSLGDTDFDFLDFNFSQFVDFTATTDAHGLARSDMASLGDLTSIESVCAVPNANCSAETQPPSLPPSAVPNGDSQNAKYISQPMGQGEIASWSQSLRYTPGVRNGGDIGKQDVTVPAIWLESRNRRKTRYSSPEDWEAQRANIKALYIDSKLDLQSVKKIMEVRYGFRASIQMYKKRFKKWDWRKYGAGRGVRPCQRDGDAWPAQSSRSTVRCLASRTKALLHESNSARFLEEGLFCFSTAITHYLVPDIRLRDYAPLLADSKCAHSTFTATQCFALGDYEMGTRYNQLAVLGAMDIFENFDQRIYECIRLLVDSPHLLRPSEDVYGKLLSYFCSLVAGRQPRHPIAIAMRRMLFLLRNSPSRLDQFIARVEILLIDTMLPFLGKHDRIIVSLRQRSLQTQKFFRVIRQEECKWWMDQLLPDLVHMAAESAPNGHRDAVLQLAHDVLHSQWITDTYTGDFIERSVQLLNDISAGYGSAGSSNLGENWKPLHIVLYLDCLHRLVDYCIFELKEIQQAAEFCKRVLSFPLDALRTWIPNREYYLLRMANWLMAQGRNDVSRELRQLWLDSPTLECRQVDKLLELPSFGDVNMADQLAIIATARGRAREGELRSL